MPPRIAIGQFAQETNSFVPFGTDMAHFTHRRIRTGADILTGWGDEQTEVPGFLSVLNPEGVEIVPLICASADSGGPVTCATFNALLAFLVAPLREAGRIDGILLALHGAMVLEHAAPSWDDPEAEILRQVRAARPGIPIIATLDLHAHVTPAMLQPNVTLLGYHEYPHIDMFETGQRAARLLLDTLAGRCNPVMALAKRPMVPSAVCARTPDEPLASIVAQARAMEAEVLLDASLFPVQPWLDVPGLGFAVLACADGDRQAAQHAADHLADAVWDVRDSFNPNLVPLDDAIRTGLTTPGMTLIGDGGDAPTSGAAADQPAVLSALLKASATLHDRPILLTLCDPEAAQAATRAGIGAVLGLWLGHAFTPGAKLPVVATVTGLHDGRFIMQDAGATGTLADHGPTAVLAIGALRIVVRSVPGREWDTGIYRSVGLEPADAGMVFVKSPGHFRIAFEPLAARTILADTPGPSCGNTAAIPWTRVTRPLWPLDRTAATP